MASWQRFTASDYEHPMTAYDEPSVTSRAMLLKVLRDANLDRSFDHRGHHVSPVDVNCDAKGPPRDESAPRGTCATSKG